MDVSFCPESVSSCFWWPENICNKELINWDLIRTRKFIKAEMTVMAIIIITISTSGKSVNENFHNNFFPINLLWDWRWDSQQIHLCVFQYLTHSPCNSLHLKIWLTSCMVGRYIVTNWIYTLLSLLGDNILLWYHS